MTRERESYDWQSTRGHEHRSTDFGPTTGFGPTSGYRPVRRPPRKSGLRWLIFTAALVLVTAVAAALLVPGLIHR
jgi:hypothetical protein